MCTVVIGWLCLQGLVVYFFLAIFLVLLSLLLLFTVIQARDRIIYAIVEVTEEQHNAQGNEESHEETQVTTEKPTTFLEDSSSS